MKKIFVLFALCCLPLAAKEDAKLVYVGWGSPKLHELAENVEWYEQEAPFDGLNIQMGLNPVVPREMKYGQFKDKVRTYKKIKFKRFKYNFFHTLIDQFDPRWLDDDAWEIIAANWGVAAKVAKEAGAVGLCFDPECYGVYPVNSYWTSKYYAKGNKVVASQYLRAARKRGQQMGAAMFKEFPNIRFWAFYLYSMNGDLLAELVNGMLDVIPPTAMIIDGDEWRGYCAQFPGRYEKMLDAVQNGYGMADKKHKKKMKKQVLLAPAFYLDAYIRPEASGCLLPTVKRRDPLALFEDNLKEARKVGGEFVWIYGEQGTWWDKTRDPKSDEARAARKAAKRKKRDRDDDKSKGKEPPKHWDEQMPGLHKLLFKDALREMAKEKKVPYHLHLKVRQEEEAERKRLAMEAKKEAERKAREEAGPPLPEVKLTGTDADWAMPADVVKATKSREQEREKLEKETRNEMDGE